MKKVISMLLVVSLMLSLVVAGISSVSAAETKFTSDNDVSTYSDKNAHYFVDAGTGAGVELAEGGKYVIKIKTEVANKNIKVVISSNATKRVIAATQKTAYTSGNTNETFSFISSSTDWEEYGFEIPADTTLNLADINYISVRCATNFWLENESPKDCLTKVDHLHTWSDEYKTDETAHWYPCVAEGCQELDVTKMKGYGAHAYDDDADMVCDTCNYDRTPVEIDTDLIYIADSSKNPAITDMNPTVGAESANFKVAEIGEMTELAADKAYIYNMAAPTTNKTGFYFKNSTQLSLVGSEADYYVSGYIYVSKASETDLILQIIPDGGLTTTGLAGGNFTNYVENWAYRYNLKGKLQDGWNYIELPLSDFKKGTEEANNNHTKKAYELMGTAKKLAAISLHENVAGKTYDLAVASLAIGTETIASMAAGDIVLVDPTETKDASKMKPTLVDNSITNFFTVNSIGDMSQTGSTEAYIYERQANHARKSGFYFETPLDADLAGNEKDYIFDAWVYIDDPNVHEILVQIIPEGCLTSTGVTAAATAFTNYTENWSHRYSLKDNIVEGWNHVQVNLNSFTKGNTGNDYCKKAYEMLTESKRIAGVTFHENGDPTKIANLAYTFAVANITLSSANKISGGGNGGAEEGPTYPTYFVSSTESGVSGGGVESKGWEAVNVGGISGDAYMVSKPTGVFTITHVGAEISAKQDDNAFFFIYISDVTNLKMLQWEIASSGTYNGACMRYQIGQSMITEVFKNGWNRVDFKLVDSSNLPNGSYPVGVFSDIYGVGLGGGMTGNVDYSAINFLRFVMQAVSTQKDLTIKIFNYQFGGTAGSTGDETPIVNIALLTLAAALVAGGIFFYNKKRATR